MLHIVVSDCKYRNFGHLTASSATVGNREISFSRNH